MLDVIGTPTSINVRKVAWTCTLLGLPWRSLPLQGEQLRDPAFLQLNPNAQVPVLRDGALVLWESNTICRYLAAREGHQGLLPTDPAVRARVEQWMDWQATDLNTAWRAVFMARVRRHPQWPDDQAAQDSLVRWNHLMQVLDAQLERQDGYVTGPAFSLADVVLGLSTQRWRSTPGERPALPAVEAWFARLAQQPGFHAHVDNGIP